MLHEWRETSTEVTKSVDSTMRLRCPMEVQRSENDERPKKNSVTMTKTQKSESNRSPPDSPNGPSDTSDNAQDNETTNTKSTEWPDGTQFFKLILPAKNKPFMDFKLL